MHFFDKTLLSRRTFLKKTSRTVGFGALSLLVGPQLKGIAQSGFLPTWERIEAANEGPSARSNHAMIFDPEGTRILVFGGRERRDFLNDVWAFSLENRIWTNITPSGNGPAPRRTPATIYDPQAQQLVTYSGQGAGFFNDIWGLDLDTLDWTEFQDAPRPAPRYGTVLAHDAARQNALTFAGFTSERGRFNDTWRFSLETNEWKELNLDGPRPGLRCLHMGTFDSDRDQFMIYGGQRNGPLADLWAFDPSTETWREIVTDTHPPARMFATMVYADQFQEVLVHGGSGAGVFGDLWVFNPDDEQWIELNVEGDTPSARHSHSSVWITGLGMMMFGGNTINGLGNDLWKLSFS